MALITEGRFEDLPVEVTPAALEKIDFQSVDFDSDVLLEIDSVGTVEQITRPAQEAKLSFPTSEDDRGLTLKSMMFKQGFEGFISELFIADSEVYFLSWAHDLSGAPVSLHPESGSKIIDVVHKARPGENVEGMGSGSLIFPAQKIAGGLAVRIQLWESDQKARDFGETLTKVADEVAKSELNQVLSLIAAAGGPTTATLAMVKEASLELAKVIGIVLKANSDDFVDFYEGYFPANEPWGSTDLHYTGPYSEIVLGRLT